MGNDAERVLHELRKAAEIYGRERVLDPSPAALAERVTRGRWVRAPHLDLISARIVEAVDGRTRRLTISTAPRMGKSLLTSVWTVAWFLARYPSASVIVTSYSDAVAERFGRQTREIIREYGTELGLALSDDSTAMSRFDLVTGGSARFVGVGSSLTGTGADLLVVDDPIKDAEEAHSAPAREKLWSWWCEVARTRLEPGGTAIVCMTRWAVDDLVGRLLSEGLNGGERWEELRLPAIAEEGDPLGREIGVPLWPQRFDAEALDTTRRAVGARVWNALYQARPSPIEGGAYFKRAWFERRWSPETLPRAFDEVLIACDTAGQIISLRKLGSERKPISTDFCTAFVIARKGADRYVLPYWIHDRLDFNGTIRALAALREKVPSVRSVLIENSPLGSAAVATLQRVMPGVIAVKPEGSKAARWSAASPALESLNVLFPPDSLAPWMGDVIEECVAQPNAAHDDIPDALCLGLNRFSSRQPARRIPWNV